MACCGSGTSCGPDKDKKKEEVSEYYTSLHSSEDLKTNACCIADNSVPKPHRAILSQIHPEVLSKFYGCGSPLPESLPGCHVVDLGCGCGRDVFLASALVGQEGQVTGVDMTPEMIQVAQTHQDYHRDKWGHEKSNVRLTSGVIEDLRAAGIADNSVDVVISNCVINLSPNKPTVFKEIFRVLKEGGELYFSDVYADRRVPKELQNDKVIWGECLSGAMYIEDFRRAMATAGFQSYSVVKCSRVTVENPEIEKRCGPIKFYSLLIRAFKIRGIEDRCEDYGQTAVYKGGLETCEDSFELDPCHKFPKGESVRVCMNTALQLSKSRFGQYFDVSAPGLHQGLFGCKSSIPDPNSSGGGCC